MRPRAYLAWMGVTIVVLALATVALAVLVDPYRAYGTPELPGWTALKPRIYDQGGIAKSVLLERAAAETLLLGNSRVEVGIDPESAQWPAAARPVFNAAEAGASLFSALRALQDAEATHPPRTVVLGLDLVDFLQPPSAPDTPLPSIRIDDRRLRVDRNGRQNHDRPWQVWRDHVATTLTIDALLDSVASLLDQDPATTRTMTRFGLNPLHEYRLFVQRSGYHGLFAQENTIYEAQYRALPAPDFDDPSRIQSFRTLQSIIRLAAGRDQRLILFIHPYHADFLEILHRVGRWPSFEAWKRALVGFVDDERRAVPGAVVLFDFSGYDVFTTEPVPSPGDTHTPMRWYWEAGHYKQELGDHVIARIVGRDTGFGRELSSSSIDAVLADINASRARITQGDTARH
jgi:hypothetical protein